MAPAGGIGLKSARPAQQKPLECTYDWCQHRFDTEKEMRSHKSYAEDHYYCKKCDVDCDDWEELTAHKVEMMAPYVEGTKKPTEEDPPKHITCEFCGEDFKSFGGRKRHRVQRHPADQDLDCPGCEAKFIRAANMIEHIEKNWCKKIRAHELHSNLQHKYVVKEIMKNPDHVRNALAKNQPEVCEKPGLITDGKGWAEANELDKQAEEDDDGVVSILDRDEPEQYSSYNKSLQPEVDLLSQDVPDGRSGESRWPRLGRDERTDLAESAHNLSLRSAWGSDDEMTSQPPTTAASTVSRPTAWRSKNTSKALFPLAKPTTPDYKAIIKLREQAEQADDSLDLRKARMWHPAGPDWQAERFFNAVKRKYCCPLPNCIRYTYAYSDAADFEEHLRLAHYQLNFSCPACFKRFPTVYQLVGHVESTRKCAIRDSTSFKHFISETTGGFLEATELYVPKIYRPSTDAVEVGQGMRGVMSNRYTGTTPEW